VIGELGKWSVWAALRRLRGCLGNATWRKARFRTPRQLRDLVKAAGLDAGPVKGAVYYPPGEWFARLLEPVDSHIARMTAIGAAFLVVRAQKPVAGKDG
jgi:hypothetical protein